MKLKYKKAFTILTTIILVLSYLNSSYACYNPTTGRFSRMDPYTGRKEQPQSLHKYVYCQNNPINRTDPSGNFSTTETMTVTSISVEEVGISLWASWMVYNALRDADSGLARRAAQQEIDLFLQTNPQPFTQYQFEQLENRVKARTRSRDKSRLYLHYGFRDTAGIFVTGTGLKAPSWCTRTVYPTGWHAKYYLAMYQGPPRNSVYVVLPYRNTKILGPNPVSPKVDQYIPGVLLKGNGIMGQGREWYFPNGTGPGTVFGPIPIPQGSLEDVR